MRPGAALNWLRRGGGPRTQAAYQKPVIAAAYAWRWALRATSFVGITGSAGKTTTKELLFAALATRHRCICNFDSDNALYPTARTVLRTAPWIRYCIQEVGIFRPGFLDTTLSLLRPRVGIVTNIGLDHRSSFHTLEAVAAEKAKLVEALPADGIAVLNLDDAHVAAMSSRTRARVLTYGLGAGADIRGELLRDGWPDRLSLRVRCGNDAVTVDTQLLGSHQAGSVLAAVAGAHALGVSLRDAAGAIGGCAPLLGRMSIHETRHGAIFLRDDFKAPAWSVSQSLEVLARAQARRKLAVIGTLSDCGGEKREKRAYNATLSTAAEVADRVFLVGERAARLLGRLQDSPAKARIQAFASAREATDAMNEWLQPGDLVLLKGSNAIDHLARLPLSLDRRVECWQERCGWVKFCDHCRLLGTPAS